MSTLLPWPIYVFEVHRKLVRYRRKLEVNYELISFMFFFFFFNPSHTEFLCW